MHPDKWIKRQIDRDQQNSIFSAKENHDYMETFITAAEYCDDMYEEEYIKAIVEVDNSAGPWVYFNEQKIPNIDVKKKTHKEFGFVGKSPGLKRKKS